MDLEQEYNLRKMIYENRDLFFVLDKNHLSLTSELDEAQKQELDKMSETVKKTKDLLTSELRKHAQLVEERNATVNSQHQLQNSCQSTYNELSSNVAAISNDNQEVVNHLDNINYSLQSISEMLNTTMKNKIQKLDQEIKKCAAVLSYLSQTFQVLKESNINCVCPICLNNQVDVYINPCGHTCCTACIRNAKYCAFCRTRISQYSKLYFN
jgi:archaellum component FlaC